MPPATISKIDLHPNIETVGVTVSGTNLSKTADKSSLLGYPGDPYRAENILIHEFAHNIHLRGLVRVDKSFDPRLKKAYEAALKAQGMGSITTEIAPAPAFYFAEAYHQQYLAKNPGGYCGLGGTGVSCPSAASA